jgi:agarase
MPRFPSIASSFALAISLSALLGSAAGAATRFRIEPDDKGVWSYISPTGERFVSMAVNNVSPEPHMPKQGTDYYDAARQQFKGDVSAWGASVAKLLTDHGFNTLGCWSSLKVPTDAKAPLYRTHILYIAAHEPDRPLLALAPDFEKTVLENTRKAMEGLTDRANTIGVFLDNEAAWFGKSGWDKIPTYTLLDVALERDTAGVAKKAVVDFLRERHKTTDAISKAYAKPLKSWDALDADYLRGVSEPAALEDRAAFTAFVAQKFFERATPVVRKELPDMLILGVRFAGDAPDSVIEACGKATDVMSVNFYEHKPRANVAQLAKFWMLTKRPIMITEWSFRAKENQSGNPNSRGAGPVLATQADRAAAYSGMVEDAMSWPMVVGMHWFEFSDQSPQGRFDGEDSNYGIVDIHNKPYPELLGAMKATNTKMPSLRGAITKTAPTKIPDPEKVAFSPGQFPNRASSMDLLAKPIREPETWSAPDAGAGFSRQGDAIVMGYDAGTQWGVGINFFGPAASKLAKGPAEATDLDGYSTAVIELTAPKGVMMNFTVVETGADFPGKPSYDVGTPADGEAFNSKAFYGTGQRETVRIDLSELHKQTGYGNQAGNSRVDTAAVRHVGLQVQGTPRKGEVVIHALRLEK